MKTAFIIVSSLLTILSVFPYLADILKRKTKPRVVSWFTWATLSGIASAASFSDGQYAAAILSFCAFIECMAIVILGLKYGEKEFTVFDISCQIGAIVGLVLWFVFNSPAVAVLASITIDFIGALPTLKHAWQKPHEETWITFMLAGVGATFTVFAASSVRVTALAGPIYIVLINVVFTSILLSRHKITRVL